MGLGIPLTLALIMAALLTVPTDNTPLSSNNPGPDGARAVVKVLGRLGVEVITAETTAEAVAQTSHDTTLVVAGPEYLSERQHELYGSADGLIVLIDPSPELLEYLEGGTAADRLTVLADPAIVSNEGIVEGDNAAVALKTLGARGRVIWNVAQWEEENTGASAWQLLPPWAKFVAAQLLVAVAGAALWRGRRMGRLTADELPVTVPASAITVGLGGLYRRAGAAGHAAAALRAGSASRMGLVLGLGPATEPATLVAGIARSTGRPEIAVRELVYGPAPRSSSQLAALAKALDQLEKEVLRQ
jgi:hypothetical protein